MDAHHYHPIAVGRLKGWLAAAVVLSVTAAAVPQPPERVRLSVPFIRQKGDWCGPAALAMVLKFHGHEASQDEIAARVHTVKGGPSPRPVGAQGHPKGGGALNLDLKLYARSLGFHAESRSGKLEDIKRELADGRPVICTIAQKRGLHYLPVVGYDEPKKELLVHLRRPFASIAFESFQQRWKAAGFWMLTITPPPAEASPDSASPY